MEISAGLAVAAALLLGPRRGWGSAGALVGPLALVALCWAVAAVGHDRASWVEAAGRTWPLILLIAVPPLARAVGPGALQRAATVGLGAAGLAALWALAQVARQLLTTGLWPWASPVAGPFSHHLTLGYALLPALAFAADQRRWGAVGLLLGGVAAAGSSGPALSAALIFAALRFGAGAALAGGTALALALIAALVHSPELHERAVLWTSGASLALDHPLGVGPLGYRAAVAPVQTALEKGFYFPAHAHDAALQVGALAGLGAWVAWAWLLLSLAAQSGRAGRAALVALLVGGLTQDTLGDLEVIRALCAWALLGGALEPPSTPVVLQDMPAARVFG